jgi:hypothetical protein
MHRPDTGPKRIVSPVTRAMRATGAEQALPSAAKVVLRPVSLRVPEV